VTAKNAVIYDVTTAFRYEENIEQLRIWNATVGANVTRAFQAASSNRNGLDVRNVLILGTSRPVEADDKSNRMASADAFVNVSANNYALVPGSAAVDAGSTIPDVTADRIGVSRPQGRAYDVGAYEYQRITAGQIVSEAWRAHADSFQSVSGTGSAACISEPTGSRSCRPRRTARE
jgi:hypothetical protein